MIYESYKESGKVPVPGLILYIVLGFSVPIWSCPLTASLFAVFRA